MCDLCSDNEQTKKDAIASHVNVAEDLEILARYYRGLAYGQIKPHTDAAKKVGNLGRSLVKVLVQDWV